MMDRRKVCDRGVDIVITWVDGDDPRHARSRQKYLSPNNESEREDIAGATRFSAQGEIEFCLLSILRYAPFVRKIHIVTDGQDPHVEEVIERNFPENKIPIEIVDHKVIFKGYEQYYPVFNSLSIETLLYRIPDLSERFVYFNDDVMLLAPITEDVWFEGDSPVCWGKRRPAWIARVLRAIKPKKDGQKVFGYKDAMLNAADLIGAKAFGYIEHAPLVQRRSSLEHFYSAHPEALEANISHKFRDHSQFNPQVLCHLLEEREYNNCVYRPMGRRVLFLKPTREKPNYMARKLREADACDELLFGCISSLDKANIEQVELFRAWFESRLRVSLTPMK